MIDLRYEDFILVTLSKLLQDFQYSFHQQTPLCLQAEMEKHRLIKWVMNLRKTDLILVFMVVLINIFFFIFITYYIFVTIYIYIT